jgi:hypothetical protein
MNTIKNIIRPYPIRLQPRRRFLLLHHHVTLLSCDTEETAEKMRWSRPPPATLPLFPTKKRKPSITDPRTVSRKLSRGISRLLPSNSLFRLLLLVGFLALIPPFFFHFRLRHLQQVGDHFIF